MPKVEEILELMGPYSADDKGIDHLAFHQEVETLHSHLVDLVKIDPAHTDVEYQTKPLKA